MTKNDTENVWTYHKKWPDWLIVSFILFITFIYNISIDENQGDWRMCSNELTKCCSVGRWAIDAKKKHVFHLSFCFRISFPTQSHNFCNLVSLTNRDLHVVVIDFCSLPFSYCATHCISFTIERLFSFCSSRLSHFGLMKIQLMWQLWLFNLLPSIALVRTCIVVSVAIAPSSSPVFVLLNVKVHTLHHRRKRKKKKNSNEMN